MAIERARIDSIQNTKNVKAEKQKVSAKSRQKGCSYTNAFQKGEDDTNMSKKRMVANKHTLSRQHHIEVTRVSYALAVLRTLLCVICNRT